MRGRLITFEGGEGAGKSTQVRRLRDRLDARGLATLVTREPGGSPRAERIRNVLLEGRIKRLGPFAEALLFAAARADHVRETIRPALDRGLYVLCDRFIDSTRVYQGLVGEVDSGLVNALERLTADAAPDLTLVLDLPAQLGLARAAERRDRDAASDRYEREGIEYHRRIREGFLEIARKEPGRCAIIDADADEENVAGAIWTEVQSRLLKPAAKKVRRVREPADEA